MGCQNGKVMRQRKTKSSLHENPLQSMVTNLKREIEVLRCCFFQVLNVQLTEMNTISEDLKWVRLQASADNLAQFDELASCFKINISQRGIQLLNLIHSGILSTYTQQIMSSDTSLGDTMDGKIQLDETILNMLQYCEIYSDICEENIKESIQMESQQQRQTTSQFRRNIVFDVSA